MDNQLAGKGFRVIEGAINENPDVPGFVQMFKPSFPVGTIAYNEARDFMQISPMARTLVPMIVIIDRQGMIRAQYTGSDADFVTDDPAQQAANIHKVIDPLLAESAAKPKPATRKKTGK
ncbi:MAG TPA: hypothetical protein VKU01_02215 [Bryobacteraceae bacterium]|nr:hypothetical protein [Bryobacteraceae bacterium]